MHLDTGIAKERIRISYPDYTEASDDGIFLHEVEISIQDPTPEEKAQIYELYFNPEHEEEEN